MVHRNLPLIRKMENIAIETIAVNVAGNIGTLALALGLIVMWKRCQMCQSNCHTSWCDFSTPAMIQKKVNLYKRAMAEFQRESIRNDLAPEPIKAGQGHVRDSRRRAESAEEPERGGPGELV